MPEIIPNLWFDTEGEEAAEFYTSIFGDPAVSDVTRYGPAGPLPEGTVMTVAFDLAGQEFIALNGGPEYSFTPAISLFVRCEDQAEVDRLWTALTDGGEESMCGWLVNRFGISWQIVPDRLGELLSDPDPERARRAMAAMLTMRKIDVRAMEDAAAGVG
jgi:predicted 3-demethylubiquinone-9 3-methyltransferase (glyoxalase superfamily)